MRISKLLKSVFAVSSVLLLTACSGGGGSSSTTSSTSMKLEGVLDSNDYIARAQKKGLFKILDPMKSAHATIANKYVNKIIAVPVVNGQVHGNLMNNSVSTTIASDGSFSISLGKEYDWVLVLLDTTIPITTPTDRTEQFCGYIALKASDTQSLLSLPAIDATISWIDIGTVTKSADLGVGSKTVNPSDFSMTAEELLTLASNDDLFKAVKNLFLNYADGIYYSLRSDFSWDGNYTALGNSFVDVADHVYRNSYSFQLDSNSQELTMDMICGDHNVTRANLEFYPPVEVNTSGPVPRTYSASDPITNSDATCSTQEDGTVEAWGTDFYAKDVGNGEISISLNGLAGNIPDGYWIYQVDSVEKGVFDAVVATPVTDTGKIKGFVPSISVNTDGTGKITSVDIKWYYLDTNGVDYVELTDTSLLKHHIGTGDIILINESGAQRRFESTLFYPSTQTSVTPTSTWYFGSSGAEGEQAESVVIFYESAGTGYFIHFIR